MISRQARNDKAETAATIIPPAIAAPNKRWKKGNKQNTCFVLRPTSNFGEDIRSYLGGSFLVRFWLTKNEHKT